MGLQPDLGIVRRRVPSAIARPRRRCRDECVRAPDRRGRRAAVRIRPPGGKCLSDGSLADVRRIRGLEPLDELCRELPIEPRERAAVGVHCVGERPITGALGVETSYDAREPIDEVRGFYETPTNTQYPVI